MKKISVLIMSLMLFLSGFVMMVYAEDIPEGVVRADVKDDSVLRFVNYENNLEFQVPVSESLGFYEVVLPYGTDLSAGGFSISFDKVNFSFDEETKKVYGIKDEWINGYNIALRDVCIVSDVMISENGGEYENYRWWYTFKDGSTYTMYIESVNCSLPEKENYTPDSTRYLGINKGKKFAFKIRIAGENEKTGEDAAVLEGKSFKITEGSAENCVIKIDEPYENFEGVICNGKKLVKDTDYTIAEGSTVVTLGSEYVKSLKAGEYTIRAVFTDCYSEPVTISVMALEEPPKAGDDYMPVLWAMLFVTVSGTALIITKKI